MAILAGGQRRFLFEKSVVYLFSYDVLLEEQGRNTGPLGWCVTLSHRSSAGGDDRPDLVPFRARAVYHVLDDTTVEDNDAIVGTVGNVHDTAVVACHDTVAAVEGRITIQTRDEGALIHSHYKGSLSLGPLGLAHFEPLAEQRPERETRAKMFIGPRFETAHPKYKWLAERQCAGFGLMTIRGGCASRYTVDIYALK